MKGGCVGGRGKRKKSLNGRECEGPEGRGETARESEREAARGERLTNSSKVNEKSSRCKFRTLLRRNEIQNGRCKNGRMK